MNSRIQEIADQCHHRYSEHHIDLEKFAELLVEAVLDEVKERAYYTGDRDWSDEVDRPWIQLEFGYGQLSDAKKQAGIK
jgi:hypothetical protein